MNVNTITVTGPRSGVAALYPLHNPAAGVGGVKTSPLLSPAPVAAQPSTAQPAPSLTYLLFGCESSPISPNVRSSVSALVR